MMDRPADRWQLDLLVRTANALEPNRIPPPIRAEVTFLLTLLMAEHLAADTALPVEASNE
jgi:type III secretory pathway component EscT